MVEKESVEDEVGLHSLFQANSSTCTTDAAFAAQVEPQVEHVATENMALAEKVDPDAAFAAQVEPQIEHVATENMALAEKVDPLIRHTTKSGRPVKPTNKV